MENSKGEFLGDANSLLLFSWKMETFMIQLKKNIDFVVKVQLKRKIEYDNFFVFNQYFFRNYCLTGPWQISFDYLTFVSLKTVPVC